MPRPTVPEVADLARSHYRLPGNNLGGNLYTVFENGNVSDGAVWDCLKLAIQEGDESGIRLAAAPYLMTRTQRGKLAKMTFYAWSDGR